AKTIKELESTVANENDPRRAAREVQAQALNTRIGILLAGGDIDEAINAYNQLVTLVPDNPEVAARREKLKAEWKPKSEEHAKARDFLLKTWPALGTVQDFQDNLPALRTNVEVCKKAGDKYAFRKLQSLFSTFAVKLDELTKTLDPNSEADRKTLDQSKTIQEVIGKLEQ